MKDVVQVHDDDVWVIPPQERAMDDISWGGAMTLTDEVRKLIDAPNFAHLATLMPDGSRPARAHASRCPSSTSSTRTRRLQIRGRVVERRPDGDLRVMDAISHKYTSAAFPRRDPVGRIVLVLEADRVRHHTLSFRHTPGGKS
jgi:hypothetical protein